MARGAVATVSVAMDQRSSATEASSGARAYEYLDRGMVREVPAPRNLPSRIPFASLDHAMVHMAGLPFKVPRTVYPWVHDFFVVPKPRQPHKWRGITNAKPLRCLFY